jgi:hypothetical protein
MSELHQSRLVVAHDARESGKLVEQPTLLPHPTRRELCARESRQAGRGVPAHSDRTDDVTDLSAAVPGASAQGPARTALVNSNREHRGGPVGTARPTCF